MGEAECIEVLESHWPKSLPPLTADVIEQWLAYVRSYGPGKQSINIDAFIDPFLEGK